MLSGLTLQTETGQTPSIGDAIVHVPHALGMLRDGLVVATAIGVTAGPVFDLLDAVGERALAPAESATLARFAGELHRAIGQRVDDLGRPVGDRSWIEPPDLELLDNETVAVRSREGTSLHALDLALPMIGRFLELAARYRFEVVQDDNHGAWSFLDLDTSDALTLRPAIDDGPTHVPRALDLLRAGVVVAGLLGIDVDPVRPLFDRVAGRPLDLGEPPATFAPDEAAILAAFAEGLHPELVARIASLTPASSSQLHVDEIDDRGVEVSLPNARIPLSWIVDAFPIVARLLRTASARGLEVVQDSSHGAWWELTEAAALRRGEGS